MHRFFVETGWLQEKKRRNPLWMASIFNAADTGFWKKRGKFRLFTKPLEEEKKFFHNANNPRNRCSRGCFLTYHKVTKLVRQTDAYSASGAYSFVSLVK